jgi:hypothetical protein
VEKPCCAAAEHPGADDRDPVANERGGVPQRVDRRLDGTREDGTGGWDALRHDRHGTGRHDVRALVRRHAAAEHERLGAAADPRPYGAHDNVGRARFGELDPADLSTTRRSQPERLCDPAIDVLVSAHCSHRSLVPKYARRPPPDWRSNPLP